MCKSQTSIKQLLDILFIWSDVSKLAPWITPTFAKVDIGNIHIIPVLFARLLLWSQKNTTIYSAQFKYSKLISMFLLWSQKNTTTRSLSILSLYQCSNSDIFTDGTLIAMFTCKKRMQKCRHVCISTGTVYFRKLLF